MRRISLVGVTKQKGVEAGVNLEVLIEAEHQVQEQLPQVDPQAQFLQEVLDKAQVVEEVENPKEFP